jgi:hypothetical protein
VRDETAQPHRDVRRGRSTRPARTCSPSAGSAASWPTAGPSGSTANQSSLAARREPTSSAAQSAWRCAD